LDILDQRPRSIDITRRQARACTPIVRRRVGPLIDDASTANRSRHFRATLWCRRLLATLDDCATICDEWTSIRGERVVLFERFRSAPRPVWSVLDVETTGLYFRSDRIVEVAVLQLDQSGRELGSWTTLLNPQRDVGASFLHGLRARDLVSAPLFPSIADELLSMLGGTVVVGHNPRFDVTFVHAECARAGIPWAAPDTLCTMAVGHGLGLFASRRLDDCCAELGVRLDERHTALEDARAVAGILAKLLPPRRYVVPRPAPAWRRPLKATPVRLRTDPPTPRTRTAVGNLASRIGVPAGLQISDEAAHSYMQLLDRVLEDQDLTGQEVDALADLAADWGISAEAANRLHLGYLTALWRSARADGVITDAERNEIEAIADLLGVPLAPVDDAVEAVARVRGVTLPSPPALAFAGRAEELRGLSVCFTGDSVCTIDGYALSRDDQERMAAAAGMIIKSGVSGRLDVLVLADPDSQSGKARKAAELGIRRIAEPAFWRMLAVRID
jgi:DNA polymerase-3 subunit epsilon